MRVLLRKRSVVAAAALLFLFVLVFQTLQSQRQLSEELLGGAGAKTTNGRDAHHGGRAAAFPSGNNAAPRQQRRDIEPSTAGDARLGAFYYPWYGTPLTDGDWAHWNHERIAHWNAQEAHKWPTHAHQPPLDIGASFYPELGPYSSASSLVMAEHAEQFSLARIGTAIVSWYPPGDGGKGSHFDELFPRLLDIFGQRGLKVAVHLEPFKDRSATHLRRVFRYIAEKYGAHPALARYAGRPIYYAYDSYQVPASEWAQLLAPGGARSIRGTSDDAFVVGLAVEAYHMTHIQKSHFDGVYTYFATDGFTYGSSYENWPALASRARRAGLTFIPCVGPGYDDTAVRPWNAANTRERNGVEYYNNAFRRAIDQNPELIAITSFNEWHEGTQIEPAVPMRDGTRVYKDYGDDSNAFLDATRQWQQTWADARG